jgi:hypothetical protein
MAVSRTRRKLGPMIRKTPLIIAAAVLGGTAAAAPAALSSAVDSSGNVAPAVRAVQTARESGRPYDLERDRYHGNRVWEVDVSRRSGAPRELKISADGRRVVHRKRTDWSDDAERVRDVKIGFTKALRTAATRADGRLTDAELDREQGRLVWSATFERGATETEVDVDATTGAVVRVRTEHDDD